VKHNARFVRASIDNGARAIPKCSKSNTQRLRSESLDPAAVLSSVLQRIGIGCGWASNVSRRAASKSACSFESAGTLSAAVSACSGSIELLLVVWRRTTMMTATTTVSALKLKLICGLQRRRRRLAATKLLLLLLAGTEEVAQKQ
jgi:hypothetical protein